MSMLLEVNGVSKSFGGLQAVKNVSFQVGLGSIHALIGPNGAGKTTTFNLINGLLKPDSGRILFNGSDVTATPVHRRAACGMARTFQTPQLFENMSVLETVMCGCHLSGTLGPMGAMFRAWRKREEERTVLQRAETVLARVGIVDLAEAQCHGLSYGHRRVLEVARALAMSPGLLLLDEVAAGLNASETANMAELVRSLAADGISVLLVEHDMNFVMGVSHEITVLDFGSVLARGTPKEIASNQEVINAYIGTWDEDAESDPVLSASGTTV